MKRLSGEETFVFGPFYTLTWIYKNSMQLRSRNAAGIEHLGHWKLRRAPAPRKGLLSHVIPGNIEKSSRIFLTWL